MKLTGSPSLTRSPSTRPAVTAPRRLPLDAKAGPLPSALDGFEPARTRSPVALGDPAPAGRGRSEAASTTPSPAAGLGRHAQERLAGSTPSPLDVGEGAPSGGPPSSTTSMPGFTTGPDLTSFATAQSARAGLLSAEVKTEATDTTDAGGGQHITESTTTTEDDGSVTTDVQTHDSDGKGNVKETQEVIRTAPDGSQQGHRSQTSVDAEGRVTTTTQEWKRPARSSTPNPVAEDPAPPSQADVDSVLRRLTARVADPSSETAAPPPDVARLSRNTAVRQGSTVNPTPDAEPTPPAPAAPSPPPRGPSTPGPDGEPALAPTPRPAGGKPGVGPRGGR